MILYRARSLNEAAWSISAGEIRRGEGSEAYVRVRGRWFTSVKADAIAYGETNLRVGRWELVTIEVADDIVDSFRVETTPYTVDGLSPMDFADRPETEYVVQRFRVVDAVRVALPCERGFRVRDYIDVNAMRRVAEDRGVAHVDLPLAA